MFDSVAKIQDDLLLLFVLFILYLSISGNIVGNLVVCLPYCFLAQSELLQVNVQYSFPPHNVTNILYTIIQDIGVTEILKSSVVTNDSNRHCNILGTVRSSTIAKP